MGPSKNGKRKPEGTATTEDDTDEAPNQPVRLVTQFRPDDIYLGRGAPMVHALGNVRFRALVRSRQEEFVNAPKRKRKSEIAREILTELHHRGARFLRKLGETERVGRPEVVPDTDEEAWTVISEDDAIVKIKQALRHLSDPTTPRDSDDAESACNDAEQTSLAVVVNGSSIIHPPEPTGINNATLNHSDQPLIASSSPSSSVAVHPYIAQLHQQLLQQQAHGSLPGSAVLPAENPPSHSNVAVHPFLNQLQQQLQQPSLGPTVHNTGATNGNINVSLSNPSEIATHQYLAQLQSQGSTVGTFPNPTADLHPYLAQLQQQLQEQPSLGPTLHIGSTIANQSLNPSGTVHPYLAQLQQQLLQQQAGAVVTPALPNVSGASVPLPLQLPSVNHTPTIQHAWHNFQEQELPSAQQQLESYAMELRRQQLDRQEQTIQAERASLLLAASLQPRVPRVYQLNPPTWLSSALNAVAPNAAANAASVPLLLAQLQPPFLQAPTPLELHPPPATLHPLLSAGNLTSATLAALEQLEGYATAPGATTGTTPAPEGQANGASSNATSRVRRRDETSTEYSSRRVKSKGNARASSSPSSASSQDRKPRAINEDESSSSSSDDSSVSSKSKSSHV